MIFRGGFVNLIISDLKKQKQIRARVSELTSINEESSVDPAFFLFIFSF